MHADDRRATDLSPTGYDEHHTDLLRPGRATLRPIDDPREAAPAIADPSGSVLGVSPGIERQFRQGVETAGTAMGSLDREGRWLQVNQRLCSLLGYGPGDFATHALTDLLGADDQRRAEAACAELQSGRTSSYDVTTRYRRHDGRQMWLDLTVTSLESADASAPCFFAVINDVTGHHAAESRREILAEVSELLATSHDLPLILDQIAEVTARAFGAWVTFDLADLAGDLYRVAVFHPDPVQAAYLGRLNPDQGDDPPRRDPAARRVMVVPLHARQTRVGTLRVGALDWNRRYDTQDFGLAEEIGRLCTLVIDNARLLAAERQATARAEVALALRDQFLSVAAHELKTPLTALLGMSQIAERVLGRSEAPDRERLRRYLGTAVDQARKLAKLVDQALDVARWENGHFLLVPE